jgi:hypothetical protein
MATVQIERFVTVPGLPDYSWSNKPKRDKMYQMTIKISNSNRIYQFNTKYLYQMTMKYITKRFHPKAFKMHLKGI